MIVAYMHVQWYYFFFFLLHFNFTHEHINCHVTERTQTHNKHNTFPTPPQFKYNLKGPQTPSKIIYLYLNI